MGWHSPKFDDLPFEFQNGILARFELESGWAYRAKDKNAGEKTYTKVVEKHEPGRLLGAFQLVYRQQTILATGKDPLAKPILTGKGGSA